MPKVPVSPACCQKREPSLPTKVSGCLAKTVSFAKAGGIHHYLGPATNDNSLYQCYKLYTSVMPRLYHIFILLFYK